MDKLSRQTESKVSAKPASELHAALRSAAKGKGIHHADPRDSALLRPVLQRATNSPTHSLLELFRLCLQALDNETRTLLDAGLGVTTPVGTMTTRIEIWAKEHHFAYETARDKFRDKAIPRLVEHLSSFTEDPPSAFARYENFVSRGRFGEARQALEESDTRSAAPLEYWRRRVALLHHQGMEERIATALDEATAELRSADKASEAEHLVITTAMALTQAGATSDAESLCLKLLQYLPQSAALWFRVGIIRWYAGNHLEAVSALRSALSLGYDEQRFRHAYAQVLIELGQLGDAEEHLVAYLKAPLSITGKAYALGALGEIYARIGQSERGMKLFAESEALMGNNAWLALRKARTAELLGDHETARTLYALSLELDAPILSPFLATEVRRTLAMYTDEKPDDY